MTDLDELIRVKLVNLGMKTGSVGVERYSSAAAECQ